jgi:hypothetical protein
MPRSALTLVVVVTAACGAPDRSGGGEGPGGAADAGPTIDVTTARPNSCDKIDLVFVIDDSDSMSQEQDNLAENFPHFISVLDAFETPKGEPIDYRVAITTTGRDLRLIPNNETQPGMNGALVERASCGMARPWIERGDANRARAFACAAEVGTDGPTVEMPLLMAAWAVTDRVADGKNAGFLRPDALLATVILTDENDCSQTGPDVPITDVGLCNEQRPSVVTTTSIASSFDRVAGGRGKWAGAAIAGPGPGICQSQFGRAAEATRVKRFVSEAGANGVFRSICDGDLAPALDAALQTFRGACDNVIF